MKAIGLFSGGLDSALAIKIIQEQDIEVIALNFVSPFCTCVGKGCSVVKLAEKLGVKIKLQEKGMDYLRIVRHPKHGYGKNLNPCIDCKIYILRKAKKYAKKINAKFIFTGEVLGQRPMSQHYKTLMLIETESGLKGKLVRPLCAGFLPPTEAEKKGWIDREKLLNLSGRTRRPQLDLAIKYNIDGFMCGGSGCRLTDKDYSRKLRDLFNHNKRTIIRDVRLLKLGRHFRYGKNKIIVGRNEFENKKITGLRLKTELIFEVKDHEGPTVLLVGRANKDAVKMAASFAVRYSDAKDKSAVVIYGKDKLNQEIFISPISVNDIEKMRI